MTFQKFGTPVKQEGAFELETKKEVENNVESKEETVENVKEESAN